MTSTLTCGLLLMKLATASPNTLPYVEEIAKYKDKDLMVIISIESSFDADAYNPSEDAVGLAQMRSIATKEVKRVYKLDIPRKPYTWNVLGAWMFLKHLKKTYRNNMRKVIIAYNCGSSCLVKKKLPKTTRNYLRKFKHRRKVCK